MSHGTIRLRNSGDGDTDGESRQTTIDESGYQWHYGPNEHHVFNDADANRMMASNATVKLGTTTQQVIAPEVIFDGDDQNAIT